MYGSTDFLLPSGKSVKNRRGGENILELTYRFLYKITEKRAYFGSQAFAFVIYCNL